MIEAHSGFNVGGGFMKIALYQARNGCNDSTHGE